MFQRGIYLFQYCFQLSCLIKVHLNPKNVFRFIKSMYVQYLNSEIFPVLNVAVVSYR